MEHSVKIQQKCLIIQSNAMVKCLNNQHKLEFDINQPLGWDLDTELHEKTKKSIDCFGLKIVLFKAVCLFGLFLSIVKHLQKLEQIQKQIKLDVGNQD